MLAAVSRFRKALLLAALLHGATLAVRFESGTQRPETRRAPVSELSVDLEASELLRDPQAEAAPNSGTASARAETAPTHAAPRSPRSALASNSADDAALGAPDAAPLAGTSPSELIAGPSASAAPASARPPIDLGLDGRMYALLPPEQPAARPEPGRALSQSIQAELLRADVAHGLARGGALVGALNEAVRGAGPTRGNAVFRVTVDAQGQTREVELVSGLETEWGPALKLFREQSKRKRVRVPAGAEGLRITFNVSSKVQRASGKDASRGPVGVSPLSLSADFDVADLSGSVQRLVYARVVSEEVL